MDGGWNPGEKAYFTRTRVIVLVVVDCGCGYCAEDLTACKYPIHAVRREWDKNCFRVFVTIQPMLASTPFHQGYAE
jgi:hypothetical protein